MFPCCSDQLQVAMPPKGSEELQTDNVDNNNDDNGNNARSFFTVPPFIKHIFDKFPLTTYPANDLPQRRPSRRHENQLFVFTDATSARHGQPSFNPQCLKWQVRRHGASGSFSKTVVLIYLPASRRT